MWSLFSIPHVVTAQTHDKIANVIKSGYKPSYNLSNLNTAADIYFFELL
jgi:hypothetical protein